jgi:hypothetical protein
MTGARFATLRDRGIVGIRDEEARSFLQGLISNDIGTVSPTRAIYATLLTPQGKFLHDFFIAEHEGGLLLDCEANRAADLIKRLTLYRLRSKVEITDRSAAFSVAVVFGIDAESTIGLGEELGVAKSFAGGIAYVDPRLAAMGARLILPTTSIDIALQKLACPAGSAEDYHRHRLALGVPDGSRDVPIDKGFLLECNFEELHAIDFNKGCYVGQELTARTKYRGTVRKRLFRVEIEGSLPPPGTAIMLGDKEVGVMRSGFEQVGIAQLRIEGFEAAAASGQPLTAGDAKLKPTKPDWVRF